jgi:nitrogen-specific signal transduction histidine kinase/CheY-like chemotaxis protein
MTASQKKLITAAQGPHDPVGRPETSITALLDRALARVGRLEAVMAISGGTLHDVNNLLTVLSGNLYLLTESVRNDPGLYDKGRRARNATERASALIREVLTFARDPEQKSCSICPANHVRAIEPLLRRAIDKKHDFAIDLCPDPWSVVASPAQLESAITNLILNARDALTGEGSIRVRVDNKVLDAAAARKLRANAGDYVRIRIEDTGIGIAKSKLARVTDVLYTDKPSGQGNGLGLAMVKRFAISCDGALSIESKEGVGTNVSILLPRCNRPAEVTANMTLPLSTLAGGDESVLLLLHDEEVQNAVQQILESLGYTVVVAREWSEASKVCASGPPVAVVICERIAGDQGQVAQKIASLRDQRPGLRQLAVLAPGVRKSDAAPDADACLYRPIAVFDLARAVRAALGVTA